MRLLKRQFGASFVRVFSLSPTLVADLAECRRLGVRIRLVPGKTEGYTIPSSKVIGIGTRGTRSYRLTALAHEMYHVLYGTAPLETVPKGMTRHRFISLLLEEETNSFVHELKVVHELLSAGVRFGNGEMRWYRRWRRGGRKAIRKMVAESQSAVTGELYPVYYGRLYDEAVAAGKVA